MAETLAPIDAVASVAPVSTVAGVASRHGVLNVCKPAGWTSHDVVARIRRLLRVRKVGHAGTLDPEATGVLPILIGQGTRLSSVLVHWDKEYDAVLSLGRETTTQDAVGEVVRDCSTQGLSPENVRAVMEEFRGEQQQVPPMYSAVKIHGQPLYKAARAGKILDRPARTIVIERLEITEMALPRVAFRVRCSKGTYIRTLCADIGSRLGVGGHLSRLVRVRVGPLHLDRAVSPDDVAGIDERVIDASFLSLDDALTHLPVVVVDARAAEKVCHGVPLSATDVWSDDGRGAVAGASVGAGADACVRVKDEQGRLLALGQWASPSSDKPIGQLKMVKVFDVRV